MVAGTVCHSGAFILCLPLAILKANNPIGRIEIVSRLTITVL